jgi:hypothetical protein
MKPYIIILLAVFTACNEPNKSSNSNQSSSDTIGITSDTMPVIKPPVHDTSGVVTTPPVNDSNVVRPDSSVKPK